MKYLMRLLIRWITLILVFSIVGCAPIPIPQEKLVITPQVADTELPLPDTIHTSPVVPASEHTPSLISEPTRTLTNTSISPLHTPTQTLPATFVPEQAYDEIKNLLVEPQKCSSPCFWGITPNTTTLDEVINFFSSIRTPLRSFQGENTFSASPHFDDLSINVELETQDGLVERVYSRIGFENYKGKDAVLLRSAFSPDNLFRLYGKPSNVEFSISYPTESGFPPGSAWYSMVLRFDQYPFVVFYFRGESKEGKLIQVCPLTDKFSAIDTLFGYNPVTYRSKGIFGMPMEKVTSLDIDNFYELMIQDNGSACFDLDSEAYSNK